MTGQGAHEVAGRLARLTGTGVTDLRPVGAAHQRRHYQATLSDGRAVFVKTADADGTAVIAAEAHGLAWLADYDLLLAMDARNLADLRQMAGGSAAAGRIRLLRSFDPALAADDRFGGQVPDPYGGTPGQYALAFDLIEAAVKGLVQRLAEFCGSQPAGR